MNPEDGITHSLETMKHVTLRMEEHDNPCHGKTYNPEITAFYQATDTTVLSLRPYHCEQAPPSTAGRSERLSDSPSLVGMSTYRASNRKKDLQYGYLHGRRAVQASHLQVTN